MTANEALVELGLVRDSIRRKHPTGKQITPTHIAVDTQEPGSAPPAGGSRRRTECWHVAQRTVVRSFRMDGDGVSAPVSGALVFFWVGLEVPPESHGVHDCQQKLEHKAVNGRAICRRPSNSP